MIGSSTIRRTLLGVAATAAALASAAVLPAAANAAPPAQTTHSVFQPASTCTITQNNVPFYYQSGGLAGYVNRGQNINVIRYDRVAGMWLGQLWGRTDYSWVSGLYVGCPI